MQQPSAQARRDPHLPPFPLRITVPKRPRKGQREDERSFKAAQGSSVWERQGWQRSIAAKSQREKKTIFPELSETVPSLSANLIERYRIKFVANK